MKKYCIFISLLLITSVLLTGCANPSYFRRNEQFEPIAWLKIAVLPFTGDVRFTQVSTDTFNLHLLNQKDFKILTPSTIEVAIRKVIAIEETGREFTVLQAQKIGELVNAEAVFIGNVTSYSNGLTLNGFSTVKLIDIKTGEIIAVSHKPSGLLFGWSEHQAVVTAVERTAKDMLKVLKELAIKNKVSKELSSPEGIINPNKRESGSSTQESSL